jgi:hypothetical protein
VRARATPLKRLAATVAGAFVALGYVPASAPSRSVDEEIVIELATAGPGTVTISPAPDDETASCKTNAQEPDPVVAACTHVFESETRVTLEAVPDKGRTFAGWSDFACRATSTRCTLTLRPGTRYVSAQFGPVTLRLFVNESPDSGDEPLYGRITVSPRSTKPCSFSYDAPCEYPRGTTVRLKRERAAPGFFWVGACVGNRGGLLDASECRLRLTSDEAVGAGYDNVGSIPPPLGSGIAVVVAGGGRVTGTVVNGTQTLNCGTRCVISGLTRYDYVRLTAKDVRSKRFSRWSNLNRERTQIVPMSSTNRIQAVFAKR